MEKRDAVFPAGDKNLRFQAELSTAQGCWELPELCTVQKGLTEPTRDQTIPAATSLAPSMQNNLSLSSAWLLSCNFHLQQSKQALESLSVLLLSLYLTFKSSEQRLLFYNKLIVFESSIIGRWISLFKNKYEDADLFGFPNTDCMIIASSCE